MLESSATKLTPRSQRHTCSGSHRCAHACQPLSRSGADALVPITPHDGAVHESTKLGAAVGHPTELGPTYEAQQRCPPQDASELLREVRAALGPLGMDKDERQASGTDFWEGVD